MQCPACGAEQRGTFCTACGAQIPAAPQPSQPVQVEQPVAVQQQAPPPASKKGSCCLIGCLGTIGIFTLLIVGVLGWLGFIPWLSGLIGPEPRDLGVEFSVEEAYDCAEAFSMPSTTSDLEHLKTSPEAFTSFDTALTSNQASSLLVLGQNDIPNWPLSIVQLRFNDDGTAEASGVLEVDQLGPFLMDNLGVPPDDVQTAIDRVQIVGDTTFYVKGACGVQSNTVDLSLSEIQIGRLTVPGSWYQGQEHQGTQYIDAALAREGFAIENVSVSGGTVQAKGTRPLESLIPWLDIVIDDRVEE